MNKLLISVLVSLALAGCGGGGESTSGAGGSGTPPATETPSGGSGGDDGAAPQEPEQPEPPVELAAECIAQPASVISPGKEAVATIKFNQPIDTTAKVLALCSAGPTTFGEKLVDVILGQGSYSQTIPGSCAGGLYQVNFEVEEHGISKSCKWSVPKPIGETI